MDVLVGSNCQQGEEEPGALVKRAFRAVHVFLRCSDKLLRASRSTQSAWQLVAIVHEIGKV